MRKYLLFTFLYFSFLSGNIGQSTWHFTEIGAGIKPSIHVDNSNLVHAAAMKEDQVNGFISYFSINGPSVSLQNVANEYFYGPIDITTSPTISTPVIAFHHHNIGGEGARGDLALATRIGADNWSIDATLDSGHDGWDGTIAIDNNNRIHSISVDPSAGIEYGLFSAGQWNIELIDDVSAMYQYGTDIDLDQNGDVHVTYFIDGLSTLRYGHQSNGTWNISDIDTDAVFPKMVLTQDGPVIAYLKVSRTGGVWATSGQVMMATMSQGSWNTTVVENIADVATGVFSGAREIVDLQIAADGTLHIAFSNDKVVRYGTFDGTSWTLQTILDVANETYEALGQQVSLSLESDGTAHLVTFRRIGNKDGQVIYGTNSGETFAPEIICPPDIEINCEVLILPSFTGTPENSESFSEVTFDDNILQECPNDIIIERSWIGIIDSVAVDTCIQIITVTVDTLIDFGIQDTLRIDEVCLNELDEIIQVDLSLPCSVAIDSISVDSVKRTCDQLVFQANWLFSNECQDTSYALSQTIIIENRVVAKLDETLIASDTGNASGSITLLPNCSFEELSYLWSNGSMDSTISGLMGGIYEVTISNSEGCMDTLSFEVMATIGDTMMMDTMTMDTMMMDTMMMDTMMMDTMMMDTMMMDTMMMDTMMMDTMMMDTMMMDTMMMDTMMMDTMMMDTMMMDTMMMDTMMMDTMMMDTMMMDTMMMDTMMMDTMMMDTMMMDTMMMDTMMMDTMMMDTMMMDTMMMDTMMMDTMMMDTMMMDTMMMDTMMMDTMMMDTMMMDTMMMDTMMMDTMMMDTMMMDTVIKTSIGLSVNDRLGNPMTADSIYFMNNDSTFSAAIQDSSGAYVPDRSLSDVAAICIQKDGLEIEGLSVQDLTRGQRIVLRLTDGCPEDQLALDVSNDKNTTAFDLALMRSILLDRIDRYPGDLVWKFVKNDVDFVATDVDGTCIILSDQDKIRGAIDVKAIKLGDLQCSEE